jgi:NAD(P)-dependent dehydrogenase (short-subunit alcohol dehydrogenase family)
MADRLRNATVVVAGASSGMGLATALAFARRGARLVLAARGAEALEDAARHCRSAGAAQALAVPTDVADAAQVRALADAAVAETGRIDVWINMAGLGALGPFEEIPIAVQRRLIEVNLIGAMNGAHAAVPHMLRQNRGVIINMSSIGGLVPTPFAAAYAASKFGLRGLSDSLRHELLARSRVQVCCVHPSFVDTPAPLRAANYGGRVLRPMPPVLDPEYVARRLVELALRPRRALHIGAPLRLVPVFALAPEAVGSMLGRFIRHLGLERGTPAPHTDGAVLAPLDHPTGLRSGWGTAERRQMQLAGLGAAGVLGTALWLALRRPAPRPLPRAVIRRG